MKRFLLAALLALTVASTAQAADVSCTALSGTQRGTICTCATGTCTVTTSAPTKPSATPAATASVNMVGVTTLDVRLCPTTGSATITAGHVDLYFYQVGKWARFGQYTSDASAAADGCVYVRFDSPGKGFPNLSRSPAWAQVVPNGTTLSAGGVSIEIMPSGSAGAL